MIDLIARRREMMGASGGIPDPWPIGESRTQDDFVWYDNKLASTGNYRNYNGWRASEMIDIEGVITLNFTSSASALGYNNFYDANGDILLTFNRQGVVQVPPDAQYMILSQNKNQPLEMTITRIA